MQCNIRWLIRISHALRAAAASVGEAGIGIEAAAVTMRPILMIVHCAPYSFPLGCVQPRVLPSLDRDSASEDRRAQTPGRGQLALVSTDTY